MNFIRTWELFIFKINVCLFRSFVLVVLAVDGARPGDGKESPVALCEGIHVLHSILRQCRIVL